MVNQENHSLLWPLFRLVNYHSLPREMEFHAVWHSRQSGYCLLHVDQRLYHETAALGLGLGAQHETVVLLQNLIRF